MPDLNAAIEQLRDGAEFQDAIQIEAIHTVLDALAEAQATITDEREVHEVAMQFATHRAEAAEAAASAMNDHADIIEGKLAQITELHTEHPEDIVAAVAAFCDECGNDWPCDTVRILNNEGTDNA